MQISSIFHITTQELCLIFHPLSLALSHTLFRMDGWWWHLRNGLSLAKANPNENWMQKTTESSADQQQIAAFSGHEKLLFVAIKIIFFSASAINGKGAWE